MLDRSSETGIREAKQITRNLLPSNFELPDNLSEARIILVHRGDVDDESNCTEEIAISMAPLPPGWKLPRERSPGNTEKNGDRFLDRVSELHDGNGHFTPGIREFNEDSVEKQNQIGCKNEE